MRLYTNIPQEEGIQGAKNTLHKQTYNPNITTGTSAKVNYLQIRGTAMRTKMAVAFPNIFMSKAQTKILSQSAYQPLV